MLNWLATLPLHTYDEREVGAPSQTDQSRIRTGIGKAMVSLYLENDQKQDESLSSEAAASTSQEVAPVHENGVVEIEPKVASSTSVAAT